MGLQRVRHDWVTFTSLHFTSYINALKCSTWTKSYKQNKWSGNIFLSMETFVSKLKHLLRTMLSSRDKMMTKGAFFYKHNFSWNLMYNEEKNISALRNKQFIKLAYELNATSYMLLHVCHSCHLKMSSNVSDWCDFSLFGPTLHFPLFIIPHSKLIQDLGQYPLPSSSSFFESLTLISVPS